MKVNDVIHGFKIERVRESKELGGTLWEMKHQKTGAELVWADNKDDNKLFSVAFKTLPWDDTGVFHILEHSVLCGSDNFPVKEPFLDLIKSSMNTFLNAMTFPDKTMYPVSSRNEQDFLNLTHVYLDAVFHPAIYTNPSILKQEGWHYELDDKDVPTYKGVVFNEMKGAFSSVDELVYVGICRMLFPDNCYKWVSGGDPVSIPDLTYDGFISAHREFYHPTNAKIYLDGDVPLDKVLTLIDEEYLSGYEKSDKKHEITWQKPVPAAESVQYYEIGKDESEENKTQMALGKITGDWNDRKKSIAVTVLRSYLTDTNESPLKRAVLESGLAQDMELSLDDIVYQPYMFLHIKNTEYKHKDAIKEIIVSTAKRLAEEGLDKDDLAAAINRCEFKLKDYDEPKGLDRNIYSLTSWLHGGDPMQYLVCDDIIAELRKEIDTGYFENLVKELFVDNSNTAELYLLPSKTKGEETMAAERKRLDDARNAWTDKELEEIKAENSKLESWQNDPDSPEAIATLPTLSVSDVSPEPQWTETKEETVDGVTVLYHSVPSNGVVHCNLHFSLADRPVDDFAPIAFITSLLGELPTKKHSAALLQREIKKNIGKLKFRIWVCSDLENSEICRPMFTASFSALKSRAKAACELVAEILKDTVYTDKDRIFEILKQRNEEKNQSMIVAGHSYAVQRALAQFSADGILHEKSEGYDYSRYLNGFIKSFDGEFDKFRAIAEALSGQVFNSSRLTVSETSTEPDKSVLDIIPILGTGEKPDPVMTLKPENNPVKEAIIIPSGVSYAAFAGNLKQYGMKFNGGLQVLSSLLTYGYLWNEIRVHGGAYGCGFRVKETGAISFHSYRDPNPQNSLQVYKNTVNFIRDFCAGDESLEKFIISSIARTEPLISPDTEGLLADTYYFTGITHEDKKRIRSEMLKLTKNDLLDLCSLFEKMLDNNATCVVGNEAAIKEYCEEAKVYHI